MSIAHQDSPASDCVPDSFPSAVHAAIRTQLQTHNEKESFFVGDEQYIHNQVTRWQTACPDIKPFYAVKCNDNPTVLKILAKHGLGFDCATKSEIQRILDLGVEPSRILYAAPFKSEDHIVYARQHGVNQTMFDSEDELRKLKSYLPTAELYLRLWADDPNSRVRLGEKFGVQLLQAKELLALAGDIGMKVAGLCFHVGSNAQDDSAYRRAIKLSREVYDYNETLGEKKHTIHTIDIGGGFSHGNFDIAARGIHEGIKEHFGDHTHLRWVAEPGRYFSDEAFHLVCRVIGTRPYANSGSSIFSEDKPAGGHIFINDGIYHNFLNAITEKVVPQPRLLDSTGQQTAAIPEGQPTYTLWGQTCDSFDKIIADCALPRRAKVDDWLCFPSMGAYTHVTASDFNGFPTGTKTVWLSSSPQQSMGLMGWPFQTLKVLHSYVTAGLIGRLFGGVKGPSHLVKGTTLADIGEGAVNVKGAS